MLSFEQNQSDHAHTLDVETLIDRLEVDPQSGLDGQQVAERLAVFGANRLEASGQTSLLVLLLSQLRSPIVWLLMAACVYSLLIGEYPEFVAILVVLVINTSIGFVTEYRARSSMQSLRELSHERARVRRNGELQEVDAETLVPGDVLVLDAGDILAADARIILSANLASDESALTGESLPASKQLAVVAADAALGDRSNMLFKGCGITRGTGEAIVTGTGMRTQLGRIADLVEHAQAEHSPLEQQLGKLSQQLIWITLSLVLLLALVGVLAGRDPALMLESAVALAVAAIPEGLPIVATLALARGMLKMARHNALMEKLSSVETLGATTVILTDKTGTLTENRMRVSGITTNAADYALSSGQGYFSSEGRSIDPIQDDALGCLLKTAALCNNASFNDEQNDGVGDPMEIALLEAASAAGLRRDDLVSHMNELAEHAFDSSTRRMATVHASGRTFFAAVKGAPDAILPLATRVMSSSGEYLELQDQRRDEWLQLCANKAARGLRLLALAGRQLDTLHEDPFSDLTLYGVVALEDPPRADVAGAIADARHAGIRIVMVTGDHQATARYIADSVGLTDKDSLSMNGVELQASGTLSDQDEERLRSVALFARVDPEQKLALIDLHQRAGAVVAMTGDGVNDAPALKKADIGIAMGIRGTQVAREASDMILKDDSFPTIVHAIREGRIIYSNIRRFTVYLLSCNLSEILVLTVAVAAGLPLPLLPLQILFLNLVTDVFPAFALGTIEPDRDPLERAPRPPGEPILGRFQWATILAHGLTLSLTTLTAMLIAIHRLGLQGDAVTTVSFMTLALSQLWHMFGMHNWRDGWMNTAVARNRNVWFAVFTCLLMLVIGYLVPPLAEVLRLSRLDLSSWTVVVVCSLLPWLVRELAASARRKRSR